MNFNDTFSMLNTGLKIIIFAGASKVIISLFSKIFFSNPKEVTIDARNEHVYIGENYTPPASPIGTQSNTLTTNDQNRHKKSEAISFATNNENAITNNSKFFSTNFTK